MSYLRQLLCSYIIILLKFNLVYKNGEPEIFVLKINIGTKSVYTHE